MRRRRLIVIGPLPPPIHGVAVSTSLILANGPLRSRFDVEHLDTTDPRSLENIGTWDFNNIRSALVAGGLLIRRLRGRKGIVYLPLSQSTPGFLRDSLFVLAAAAWRWRVAAHLRGSDFRSYYEACSGVERRWIRFTLRRIDSIAVMGTSLKGVFEGIVPHSRIAVVPNGTPEPALQSQGGKDCVVFLSNLRRRKGVVEALEAALIVLARRPSARFVFAGAWEDDELERELRAKAEHARGAIEFRPAVCGGEKDRLLATASVFLFPPVEPEGHPRVVLEALAAGVPVVTTDRGAIRETVTDEENGYVLDHPSPHSLAACISRLLDDRELHGRFSRAARHAYLARFTQAQADEAMSAWLTSVQ